MFPGYGERFQRVFILVGLFHGPCQSGNDYFIIDQGEAEVFDTLADGTVEVLVRKKVRGGAVLWWMERVGTPLSSTCPADEG